MNRKYAIWTTSILLTAAVGLGGSALAASQDAQQPAEHQAQAADASGSVPAACGQMMTELSGYMADMEQMMGHMHQGQTAMGTDESHGMMGDSNDTGHGSQSHGMMGGSSGITGGSHGMMGGSSGATSESSGMMGGSYDLQGDPVGMMGNLAATMERMMGMMGTMADTAPAKVDSAATAEQEAAVIETMVANIRPQLDEMLSRAAALRRHAAEIR